MFSQPVTAEPERKRKLPSDGELQVVPKRKGGKSGKVSVKISVKVPAKRIRNRHPLPHSVKLERLCDSVVLPWMYERSPFLFEQRDMIEVFSGVGGYAMLSPRQDHAIECAMLMTLNKECQHSFSSVLLAGEADVAAVQKQLAGKRVAIKHLKDVVWSEWEDVRLGSIVVHSSDVSEVNSVFETLDIVDAIMYSFPGHHAAWDDMFVGESRYRKAIHFASDHIALIKLHAQCNTPYVPIMTNPDAAYDYDHTYGLIAGHAIHQGSAADVQVSLLNRWRLKHAPNSWLESVADKVSGEKECPICFEAVSGARAVMECCANCYCVGCLEKWVFTTPSCPSCRFVASYNSAHVVTAANACAAEPALANADADAVIDLTDSPSGLE